MFAVDVSSNGGKNVCPTGWHVPTNAELVAYINFLGGTNTAGGKMKEAGFAHWNSPNTGATNESGFTALPGGSRNVLGGFDDMGTQGNWWTSNLLMAGYAMCLELNYNDNLANNFGFQHKYGYSVRCIED